jgi:hypothetical protein
MVGVPKGVVGVPCMCRPQPQRKPPPGAMPRPARRCKPQRRSSTRSTPGLRRRATELRRRRPTWTSLPSRRMAHAVHCAVHMLLHAHCSPVPDLTANRSLPPSPPLPPPPPLPSPPPFPSPQRSASASTHAPCILLPARPCLRPAPMLPLSRPRPRPMPTPCTAAATHAAAHHRSRLRTIRSAHYLDEDRYIPRTLEVRWLCMYAHTHAACVHTHTAHVATGSLQHGCRPPSRRRRAKESKRGAPHRAPPDPRQEERPPDPRQEERRPAPAMTPPPRLHHRGRSRCRSRCRSRRRRRRRPQRPRRQASRRPCSMPPPSCRSLTCRCLRRRRRRRCRREARTRNREGRHGGSSSSRAAGSLSLPSGRHPPTGRSGRRALGGGRASQARGTARHPARATG